MPAMSGRVEVWLFIAQRFTAALLAPLVLVHLGTMIVAVQGGLSADEILARTRGNLWWAGFYGLFVAAAAVHGSIGLRAIVREWAGWRGHGLDAAAALFGAAVLILGMRAVGAVT